MPDEIAVAVADASVMINLNATERASEILAALPFPVVMTDIAADELSEDRQSGRRDGEILKEIVRTGGVTIVSLGEIGLTVFGSLVIGSAEDTLDDGEAATLAYAAEKQVAPVIDERKAVRICRARFPGLPTLTTADLLLHHAVMRTLGQNAVAEAVFLALQKARMRVAAEHLQTVVALIGAARAESCTSLPRSARFASQSPPRQR